MKSRLKKYELMEEIQNNVEFLFRKKFEYASDWEIYVGLCHAVRKLIMDDWIGSHEKMYKKDAKKLYYLSMEFLVGRALGNNIISLQEEEVIRDAISALGKDLSKIEDQERDPALGNGGLGRLAACFLDSLSTLNYPAYGCGIRYQYGLFRQKIMDGYQVEMPDAWIKDGYPFEVRRDNYTCEVKFNGYVETLWDGKRNYFVQRNYDVVKAVPYDMPVLGYGNHFVNTLRAWDAEPVEQFSLGEFDRGNYMKAVEQTNLADTITNVLYPNDNHEEGKTLRLRQQYFFVSASVQTAIKKFSEKHEDIFDLPNQVIFHMNDTHPTLCVPELMRILLDDYRLEWDDAFEITRKTCAFTNHTIMSEALEKWPVDLFQRMLPRIWQIVCELDRRLKITISERFDGNPEKIAEAEIVHNGQIRMANMAIYGSSSVNGVAEIHSEILKTHTFRVFYETFPERFSNKTNGITQRRFLLNANPLLSAWVSDHIGDGWITDLPQMKKLEPLCEEETALSEFMEIKRKNKERLAAYIKEHNGIEVDPESIFDVQVKRLHEYKRQLMNILHVMYLYNRLKDDPSFDMVPHTFIFGAKAAPGYYRAKLIIKLINAVADVINRDESVNGKIKVVFIEDYCVSNAELIFPAADISEQISTASKEASGTSNMKFMLNGALTLGTMDGANIEIVEAAGRENAFIFGMSADEVMAHERDHDYDPMQIFNSDPEIRKVLMQLVNGFYAPDDPDMFAEIYNSLLTKSRTGEDADPYFILKDFRDYIRAHEEADRKYRDRKAWAKSALMNTANCGRFSSDRTIEEYVNDIWHLEKVY